MEIYKKPSGQFRQRTYFCDGSQSADSLGEIAALLLGRIFIDLILPENSGGWMSSLIQAIFLLALFQLTAHTLSSRYLTKVKGKLSMVSQAQFMWHILRLPMEFFSQRMAGDLAIPQKRK